MAPHHHSVVNGFPALGEAEARRPVNRLPVAGEIPFLHQVSILPMEAPLVPGLRAERSTGIGTGLRRHKDVLLVREWCLVMNQEATLVGELGVDVWIEENVGELSVDSLPLDIDETLMLRVLAPLVPIPPSTVSLSSDNDRLKGQHSY